MWIYLVAVVCVVVQSTAAGTDFTSMPERNKTGWWGGVQRVLERSLE